MKKILLVWLFVFIGISFGGYVLYQKYQGALPAILPPAKDIGRLLDGTQQIAKQVAVHNQELKNELGIIDEPTKYYQQGPLTLPEGFSISVYADNLDTPRVITHAPNGGLLVSEPKLGQVLRVQDTDGDGKTDIKKLLLLI